jgi:hypothetical protein
VTWGAAVPPVSATSLLHDVINTTAKSAATGGQKFMCNRIAASVALEQPDAAPATLTAR